MADHHCPPVSRRSSSCWTLSLDSGACRCCTLLLQRKPTVFAHWYRQPVRTQAMHPRTTRLMNSKYNFDASRNSEVRCSWYRLCLGAGARLSCSTQKKAQSCMCLCTCRSSGSDRVRELCLHRRRDSLPAGSWLSGGARQDEVHATPIQSAVPMWSERKGSGSEDLPRVGKQAPPHR